jgi:hypothetical protein
LAKGYRRADRAGFEDCDHRITLDAVSGAAAAIRERTIQKAKTWLQQAHGQMLHMLRAQFRLHKSMLVYEFDTEAVIREFNPRAVSLIEKLSDGPHIFRLSMGSGGNNVSRSFREVSRCDESPSTIKL